MFCIHSHHECLRHFAHRFYTLFNQHIVLHTRNYILTNESNGNCKKVYLCVDIQWVCCFTSSFSQWLNNHVTVCLHLFINQLKCILHVCINNWSEKSTVCSVPWAPFPVYRVWNYHQPVLIKSDHREAAVTGSQHWLHPVSSTSTTPKAAAWFHAGSVTAAYLKNIFKHIHKHSMRLVCLTQPCSSFNHVCHFFFQLVTVSIIPGVIHGWSVGQSATLALKYLNNDWIDMKFGRNHRLY